MLSDLLLIGTGASTTGPDGAGIYATTYNIGPLGGILNREAAIGFETTVNGWTSPRVTRVTRWPLVGASTCTPS